MRPAFSVLFLTTLIGAAQGLLIALVAGQLFLVVGTGQQTVPGGFYAQGAFIALVLLALGLLASFFHLANPARAWRAASQWRTSWLSREVIALPAVMGMAVLYGGLHWLGLDLPLLHFANGKSLDLTMAVGFVTVAACVALFICTGMIYACVKFIREWASVWTVINYTLMGLASGFTLAAGFAASWASVLTGLFTGLALLLTIAALAGRGYSLWRNAGLRPLTTLKGAIGAPHQNIRQVSQGFGGSSFNTKEFFHGVTPEKVRALVFFFIVAAFLVPLVLLALGAGVMLWLAFVIQYVGLLAERWVFFAHGNHVQNLYYQRKA